MSLKSGLDEGATASSWSGARTPDTLPVGSGLGLAGGDTLIVMDGLRFVFHCVTRELWRMED
jgi:hypothetical protein